MSVETSSDDQDVNDVKQEQEVKEEEVENSDGDDDSDDQNTKEVSQETKEEPTPKKKHTNWPLRDIKEPHANDVLYGRGGGTCRDDGLDVR